MTSRQKLLAAIIASYAIACGAAAGCLYLVTARYEAAVESAENLQLDRILNRQIDDLAWHRYAEVVSGLARDIAQEPQIRSLVAAGDFVSLWDALPHMWHRSAVTSGEVALLGIGALRGDGSKLANEGAIAPTVDDLDIQRILSQRQGIDRLKILTRVWVWQGRPVLTVIHPVG